jgi:hypothetical protein
MENFDGLKMKIFLGGIQFGKKQGRSGVKNFC